MFPSTSLTVQHLVAHYSGYQILFAHRINAIDHLSVTHMLNAKFAVVNKRESFLASFDLYFSGAIYIKHISTSLYHIISGSVNAMKKNKE